MQIAHRIIKTVASPLRFFAAVAVLLVAVILILPMQSTLPVSTTNTIIVASFVVLILLIFLVTYLVVFHPRKLTFDQEAHLAVMRERLGDNETDMIYVSGEVSNVSLLGENDQEN